MDDEPNERNIPSIVISDDECPLPDSTMPDSTMPELADTEGSHVTDENNWIVISDTSADAIVGTTSKKKKRRNTLKNKNTPSRHEFTRVTRSKARRMRSLEKITVTRPSRSTLQKRRCIFHRFGKTTYVMPTRRRESNTSTQNNETPAVRPTIDVQSTSKTQSIFEPPEEDQPSPPNDRPPSSLPKKPFNFVERFQIKPSDKMVAIGTGHTLIDRFNFQVCDWSNYMATTNRLLMGVFGKKILATHTLTGKASPAFNDKTPMKKLDPKKVADIIMTVSEVCDVTENLVRKSISRKCASEKKLQNIRQAKKTYLKTLRSQNSSVPDG